MDPAQYSSKAFAACFFAAANSLFLISESFLMSLAIIPSSFKFRSGSDGELPPSPPGVRREVNSILLQASKGSRYLCSNDTPNSRGFRHRFSS